MSAPADRPQGQTSLTIADRELKALERRVRAAQTRGKQLATAFYRVCIDAGNAALEAKKRIPHGQFTAWLEASCEVSVRSARRWMRLAETGLTAEEVAEQGGIRALVAAASDKAENGHVSVLPEPEAADPAPDEAEQEMVVSGLEDRWAGQPEPEPREPKPNPIGDVPLTRMERLVAENERLRMERDSLEQNADAVMAAELSEARQTIAGLRADVNVLKLRAEAAETRCEALARKLKRFREGKGEEPSVTVGP